MPQMNQKAKKVVFLTGNYYEQIVGGAEYQAYMVATEALKRGYEIHYIFISNGNQFGKHLDIKLHPIKKKRLEQRFGIDEILYYNQIRRLLKNIDPGFIYQRGGSALTGITAICAKKYSIKMVWHAASDNDLISHKKMGIIHRPTDNLNRAILNYGIRKSDVLLAQSYHQSALIKRKFGRKCDAIIPNGHPFPKNQIQKSERVKVLWISNMKPLKQPEIFVQLADSLGNMKNVSFLMIGRASSLSGGRKLLEKIRKIHSLECIGEIPNDEVNRYLSEAHILVNTSRYEGFSNTFIQAWMRSVPVVSLNVDPDGILKREKIGFHSRTFETLCRDVKHLVENKALRKEMGYRARRYAGDNHTVEKMVKGVINFFQ
jgi:glycosyltransferase involved in cell wall biosynthesis